MVELGTVRPLRTLMKACALKVRRSWMSAKMRLRVGLRGATASPLLPSCSSNTCCSTPPLPKVPIRHTETPHAEDLYSGVPLMKSYAINRGGCSTHPNFRKACM